MKFAKTKMKFSKIKMNFSKTIMKFSETKMKFSKKKMKFLLKKSITVSWFGKFKAQVVAILSLKLVTFRPGSMNVIMYLMFGQVCTKAN